MWVPELNFRIKISEFCVSALFSSILSVLVGVPVDFSSEFAGVEYIADREVLLLLPDDVYRFVWSVGFSGLCPFAPSIL